MEDIKNQDTRLNRRSIIGKGLLATAAAGIAGVAAAQSATACLTGGLTPSQPEGPFYPLAPQDDVDADLTLVKGKRVRARGDQVELWIRVQDENCEPLEGALVDLWQACATGKYDHPSDPNTAEIDPNFQYWAQVLTNSKGYARVRTIKPGAYPASAGWVRPPHIHFKISAEGRKELITQMYFDGEALNSVDEYWKRLTKAQRARLTVAFKTSPSAPEALPRGIFTVTLAPGLSEN